MKHHTIFHLFSFCLVLSALSLCTAGADLPDKTRLLGPDSPNGETSVVPPARVPEVTICDIGPPADSEERFGGDRLLADLEPDVEGFVDMVSSDTQGMFLAWECLDEGNTAVYIYRSMDGGDSWVYFADLVSGTTDEVRSPALAIPEFTQHYLYLIFEYINEIQVCRIDLDTHAFMITTVDTNPFGVHYPRIVTDEADYPGNYWLYVTYISGTILDRADDYIVKAARSVDEGLNWTSHTNLDTIPLPLAPDIAYGETTLHVTWTGDAGTGFDVYTSRSSDLGSTWGTAMNLTSGAPQNCYNPRAAAIQGDVASGGEVVVAFTREYPDDPDVWYTVSEDRGVSWSTPHCLACSSSSYEMMPDIDADPSYGAFHIAYWQDFSIMYSMADRSDPTSWSEPLMVSDTGQAEWMFGQPTTAYDWISGEHGVAWPDFRVPTWAVYYDRQDWLPGTVGCSYTCNPPSGILPFSTQMTATLSNQDLEQSRRIAGRINVYLADGSPIGNWKAGFANIVPGDSYVASWNQTIPALFALAGINTFHLIAEDVTPAPYNQPPYRPSGDTDTSFCTVTGIAP